MSTFLKVTLALLLTLPLGAYVAGTLVSARTDMPAERAPVVVETSPSETEGGSTGTPNARPSRKPTGPAGTDRPDDADGPDDRDRDDPDDRNDDDRDDRDDDGRDDDDDVRVVRPTPRDVTDDHGGDRGDRDDGDDDGDGDDGGDDDEGGDDSADD